MLFNYFSDDDNDNVWGLLVDATNQLNIYFNAFTGAYGSQIFVENWK